MRRLSKKLSVFFLGLAISLIFCELALRGVGVWHWWERHYSAINVRGEKFTILCIGNSHTEGIGAEPGLGYPEQLGTILQQRHPGIPIRVINRGISNATSSNVLESLSHWIKEVNADVVTLRMGEPNLWNYSGLLEYEKRKSQQSVFWIKVAQKLKTISFVQRAFYDLKNKNSDTEEHTLNHKVVSWIERLQNRDIQQENSELSEDARTEILEQLEHYNQLHPKEHFTAYLLSELYFLNNKYEQSIYWAERALHRFGRFHFLVYEMIQKMKRSEAVMRRHSQELSRLDQALMSQSPKKELLKRMADFMDRIRQPVVPGIRESIMYKEEYGYLLEMSPGAVKYATQYIYKVLMPQQRFEEIQELLFEYHMYNTGLARLTHTYEEIYKKTVKKDPGAVERLEKRVRQFNAAYKKKFGVDSLFLREDAPDAEDWAMADTRESIALIRSLGAEYVLLNYPPPPYNKRRIDDRIRNLAETEGYNFIDTTKNMERVIAQLPKERRLSLYALQGSADEHLNAKGYAHLAQELADYLEPSLREYEREMRAQMALTD